MTPPEADPTGEADDADVLDQHTPATAEPADESETAWPDGTAEADEADLLDQTTKLTDDDDYPRDEPGTAEERGPAVET